MIEQYHSFRAVVAQCNHESLLALLFPAIALGWVIADVTSEFPDRDHRLLPPIAQYASAAPSSDAFDAAPAPQPVVVCSAPDAEMHSPHLKAAQRAALRQLCRAGLRFSASLPNG